MSTHIYIGESIFAELLLRMVDIKLVYSRRETNQHSVLFTAHRNNKIQQRYGE